MVQLKILKLFYSSKNIFESIVCWHEDVRKKAEILLSVTKMAIPYKALFMYKKKLQCFIQNTCCLHKNVLGISTD